jgi:NADH dehydrogenase/NADH:ubiquinone oxidoreductase subunit G
LLEINGQRNQQGCMIPVSDGMKIKRQLPPKVKIL